MTDNKSRIERLRPAQMQAWVFFLHSDKGEYMSQFVKDFYNSHAENEWDRLNKPLCRIEFVSTLRLIDQYFPKQGRICDIGGGPGRYTIELLRKGYWVTLFDLSEEEIRFASMLLKENGLSAEQLIVGDARDMSMLEGVQPGSPGIDQPGQSLPDY